MRYIQYYKNCYFHARDIQRYNLSYAFNFRNSFYALAQFFVWTLWASVSSNEATQMEIKWGKRQIIDWCNGSVERRAQNVSSLSVAIAILESVS